MDYRESPLNCKKNIKWFLSRIENFNSAVPYQIDTLAAHKVKIHQAYKLENYSVIRQERISAEKSIRNLKQLQIDIDSLREQVVDSDQERFDKLVQPSCERIKISLTSFSDFYDKLPLERHSVKPWNSYQVASRSNGETDQSEDEGRQSQIMLQMREDMWQLEEQTRIALEVEKIEEDSRAVNEIFRDLATMIHDQGEKVDIIEDHVEETHTQVRAAEQQLAQVAAKLKFGMYPLIGALAGTIVGGPIGLVAGVKVGTVVAVTGGFVGFSGGKVLKLKEQRAHQNLVKNVEAKSTVGTPVACENGRQSAM